MPSPDPFRILVIGGAGVFGARLVAALQATTDFEVIVAGRHAVAGGITGLVIDRRRVTAAELAATGAFAVVDAAGPFQGGDTHLARAAIGAGLHYVDLADARDFVAGFGALDEAARAAGVTALTGASTSPALSNAALDALTAGWTRISRVEIAISPGNRAPRGLSVIRAILCYTGQPVRVFTGGAWCRRAGWGMMVRRSIPGIGMRFLSLVETPDLDIVPSRFRVEDGAITRAGLELPALHLGLWIASLPVRLGLVGSLAPLAKPVRAAASLLAGMGTDRGGMTVDVLGYDEAGHPVEGHWSLLAEAGDGPSVPSLPALAALRALAHGRLAHGARPCVGVLTLAAIEAEFAHHRITTRMHRQAAAAALYRRVLGRRFDELPEPVRRMHEPGWRLLARGRAAVDGPSGPIAAIIAVLFRFPHAARDTRLSVEIVSADGQETWIRTFGDRRFASILSAGAKPGRIVERFGPLSFELDLPTSDAGVFGMPVRAWRIGPMALPRFLAPIASAREDVDELGRFRFDVALALPFGLGRVVRYRGWLVPR